MPVKTRPLSPFCVSIPDFGLPTAALGLLVALVQLAPPAAGQCRYEVTVITGPSCPPLGIPPTRGKAINERGDVAGFYSVCGLGADQAYLWTQEQGLVLLSIPGASESVVTDMSGDRIVGCFNLPDDELSSIAFLRDGEDLIVIPPLPGATFSSVTAVNDLGQVVGCSVGGFLWEAGEMTPIGPYKLGAALPRDVNNAGQVVGGVGSTLPSNPTGRAFIWEDGQVTLLDAVPGGLTSRAWAINNRGQIVGDGLKLEPDGCGFSLGVFLWSGNRVIDLGKLPGLNICNAIDINDYAAVVGGCSQCGNQDAAFLWQNGSMWRLSDLIDSDFPVSVRSVGAINNKGQIACWGVSNAATTAFRLTPIDPPTGDIDIDCRVGIVDFLILLRDWGPCESAECGADLNGDGMVGVADFVILILNWGPSG